MDAADKKLLREIIDTLFFASLGREEGEITRVRVVYHENGIDGLRGVEDVVHLGGGHYPIRAWEVMALNPAQDVTDFTVKALVKIAPAAALPRSAVLVGPSETGRLTILGIARRIEYGIGTSREDDAIIFNAPRPGHITMSSQGTELYSYADGKVIRLDAEQEAPTTLRSLLFAPDSVIRQRIVAQCDAIIKELPTKHVLQSDPADHVVRVVYELVEQMARMRHGGMIAMFPKDGLRFSKKYVIRDDCRNLLGKRTREFFVQQANTFDLRMRQGLSPIPPTDDDKLQRDLEESTLMDASTARDSAIESVSQLTAVDNALLIGKNLEILCAGYPVEPEKRKKHDVPVLYSAISIKGAEGVRYWIEQHGSRHHAAANFAWDNPGGVVFIRSQDGPLRCLHRPGPGKNVLIWNLRQPEV